VFKGLTFYDLGPLSSSVSRLFRTFCETP